MQKWLSGPRPSGPPPCHCALEFSTEPMGLVKDRIQAVRWWHLGLGRHGRGGPALAGLTVSRQGQCPAAPVNLPFAPSADARRGLWRPRGPCCLSAFPPGPPLSPKVLLRPHLEASAFVGGQVRGSGSLQTRGLPPNHWGARGPLGFLFKGPFVFQNQGV